MFIVEEDLFFLFQFFDILLGFDAVGFDLIIVFSGIDDDPFQLFQLVKHLFFILYAAIFSSIDNFAYIVFSEVRIMNT